MTTASRDAYAGGQGAAALPALIEGVNYFSAKMFMMRPQ